MSNKRQKIAHNPSSSSSSSSSSPPSQVPSTWDEEEGTFVYNGDGLTVMNGITKQQISKAIIGKNVTTIPDELFYSHRSIVCPTFEEIYVPDQVHDIGVAAFRNCEDLLHVHFSTTSKLKIIRREAFQNCRSLQRIYIPESVESIGSSAFSVCRGLTEIHLCNNDSKIKYIEERTFANCKQLTIVTLPDSIKEIRGHAFYCCTKLKSITVPETLEVLGDGAFLECIKLQDIFISQLSSSQSQLGAEKPTVHTSEVITVERINRLPNSVKSIGDYSFTTCSNLLSMTLPDTLEEIPSCAFQHCFFLREVIFPKYLRIIKSNAFQRCPSLLHIDLPNSLQIIENFAFSKCKAITGKVILPSSIKKIGRATFSDCVKLEEVVFPQNNSIFWKIEEHTFAGCTSLTTIVLPTKLQWIQHDAFINCPVLSNLKLPKFVEKVDNHAFKGCNKLFSPLTNDNEGDDGNSTGTGSTSYITDFDTNSIHFSCDLVRSGARYLIRETEGRIRDDDNDEDDGDERTNERKKLINYPASLWPLILHRIYSNEMRLPKDDIFDETETDNNNINSNTNNVIDDPFIDSDDDDDGDTLGKIGGDWNILNLYTNVPSIRRSSVVYYMMIHGVVMDARMM